MIDKKEIEKQLLKLKNLENKINDLDEDEIDDDMNLNFLKELDGISEMLSSLDNAFKGPQKSGLLNVKIKRRRNNSNIYCGW